VNTATWTRHTFPTSCDGLGYEDRRGCVQTLYAPYFQTLPYTTVLIRPPCSLRRSSLKEFATRGARASFPDPSIRRGLSPPRENQGYISPSTSSAFNNSPLTSLRRRSFLSLCFAPPFYHNRAHVFGQTPGSMAPRRSTRRSLLNAPSIASPPPAAVASRSQRICLRTLALRKLQVSLLTARSALRQPAHKQSPPRAEPHPHFCAKFIRPRGRHDRAGAH
jgi:hypothetical protein